MKIILVIFILCGSLSATTYYVSHSTGSDSNNGTSTSTPWKYAPGMTLCANTCLSTTLHQTDIVVMKGGDVWPLSASNTWFWNAFGSVASTPNVSGYPGICV